MSTALAWAGIIAAGMSTQYLFQPFVWANWPVDEVMIGWLEVARDRALVAFAIATSLVIASRIVTRSLVLRTVILAVAIVGGAIIGELVLLSVVASPGERADLWPMLGRTAHWCVLAGGVAAMYYFWFTASNARATAQADELHVMRLRREIVQTRLQSLRNQIEPHFLFNTLATVRRMHQSEPANGAQLLRHLVEYLRLTLSNLNDSQHTLAQEVELVRAYLGVVRVRMSGRLQTRFDVADRLLACECPPLTLATLIENAVIHGIGPKPEGGIISVEARLVGDVLELMVSDTGVGFSQNIGSGIGLSNIRARLQTLYGSRGQLTLANMKSGGVCATIRLPHFVHARAA